MPFRAWILLAALTPLAACGPGTAPGRKAAPDIGPMDRELFLHYARNLKEYTDALLLCSSAFVQDWDMARRQLEVLTPFHVFDDDLKLVREFRAGSDKARYELGRRGVVLHAMSVFSQPYDKRKWSEASGTLLAAGEPGRVLLLRVLLGMLINGQNRDVWPQIRNQIREVGPEALQQTVALAQALARETPAATPIFKIDDLSQIVLLLIDFGDAGRAHVEALSRHEKPNVRRGVAKAIGDGLDAEGAPILARLATSDPDWVVRAGAAQAASRLGAARAVLGPALLSRISKDIEPDRMVLCEVLKAIGQIHYADAVPALMAALEHPDFKVSEAAMIALYHISGEKHTRKELWAQWYRAVYPGWVKKQAR